MSASRFRKKRQASEAAKDTTRAVESARRPAREESEIDRVNSKELQSMPLQEECGAVDSLPEVPDAAVRNVEVPDTAALPDAQRNPRGRRGSRPVSTVDHPSSHSFALYATAEQPGPRLAPVPLPAAPEPPLHFPPVSHVRRFNTTRLLPAKYSESVLTRIADNDDLQLIFELDNATNDRLLAERNLRPFLTSRELVFDVQHYRIVNAAFTHPHPQGGRFSMPYRGAWYAAFELATAKAEVLFHRALQFAEISWRQPEELDYDQYLADFSGTFHDLRPDAFSSAHAPAEFVETQDATTMHAVASGSQSEFAACLDPGSYVASQQLAIHLIEAGSLGIIYPSTRRKGGNCIACFRPSVVANVRKRDLFRLTWYPDRAATFVRTDRTGSGTTNRT